VRPSGNATAAAPDRLSATVPNDAQVPTSWGVEALVCQPESAATIAAAASAAARDSDPAVRAADEDGYVIYVLFTAHGQTRPQTSRLEIQPG